MLTRIYLSAGRHRLNCAHSPPFLPSHVSGTIQFAERKQALESVKATVSSQGPSEYSRGCLLETLLKNQFLPGDS